MSIDPPYIENLAALIESQIKDRTLKSGDKLPSSPQLAALYGISLSSARLAVQRLKDRGLVRGHMGKGVYVI